MRSTRMTLVLFVALAPLTTAGASSIEELVDELSRRGLIRRQSVEIDRELDRHQRQEGLHPGGVTRVVPARRAGDGEHVGAYQIFGERAAVSEVRSVFEVEGMLVDPPGRAVRLVPSGSRASWDGEEVHGVYVGAAVDTPVWGPRQTFVARELSFGGAPFGRRALRQAGPRAAELDRSLDRSGPGTGGGRSRVVPVLRAVDRGYLGLAQVTGRGVGGAGAVMVEQTELEGRRQARTFVPVGGDLVLQRLPDVGVRALVANVSLAPRGGGSPFATSTATARPGTPSPPLHEVRRRREQVADPAAPPLPTPFRLPVPAAPVTPLSGTHNRSVPGDDSGQPAPVDPARDPVSPRPRTLPDRPGGHMGPLAAP